MFIHLLLLAVTSADDDPTEFDRFERHHYENRCDHFKITNGAININSDDYASAPDYVLRDCTNFHTVNIGAGINKIKEYTFYGSSIVKINFANNDVKTIGRGAFAHCTKLEKLSLPTELSKIEEGAFLQAGINSATINLVALTELSSIGNSAFEESPLISGTLSLPVKSESFTIGKRAFYGTKITTLTLSKMQKIDSYAFADCLSLTTCSTLDVGEIGSFAFSGCKEFGGNLAITTTKVDEHAFSSTKSTLKITRIAQRTITGTNPTQYQRIEIGSYAFANKIIACSLTYTTLYTPQKTTIRPYAFYQSKFEANQNINLQYVTIEKFAFANSTFAGTSSLTLYKSTVGQHAFEFTSGAGSLTLQTSKDFTTNPITFGAYSFYYSTVLTAANNVLYLSNANYKTFAHCTRLVGSLTFKGNEIYHYAFANCTGLTSVLINEAKIDDSAFEFCTGLTKINITASYEEGEEIPELAIGNRAFYGCSSLKEELVLHSYITKIGEYAFGQCTGLTNTPITIYSNTISPYAFYECKTLNGPIKIYSEEISFHAFDKNTLGTLTIDTKYEREKIQTVVKNEAFYNIKFTGNVYIKDNVKINDFAFIYCIFHEKLIIDAESIGKYAFSQCNASNNCNVSIGETKIDEHAFEFFGRHQNSLSLEFHAKPVANSVNSISKAAFNTTGFSNNLVIPHFYTGIGEEAFANCIYIPSVDINFGTNVNGISLPNIGKSAFEGCSKMTHLSITSEGLSVSIGERAFYGLKIEDELKFPLQLSGIGTSAFAECQQLKGAIFNYHTSQSFTIGSYAFSNCKSLKGEIYIPTGVRTIGSSAFENCSQLNRLTLVLEGSLTNIYSKAFYGCTNLEGSLDIPYKVTTIGSYAFYNCVKLGEHLSLRANSNDLKLTINNNAFENCANLKHLDFLPNTDNDQSVYQKLRHIYNEAFLNSGLTGDLYIPSTLETIGESAFRGLKLGRLLIDEQTTYSLSTIGTSAFQDSTISSSLIIPSSVTSIGNSAFENCRNIVGLNIISKYNTHSLRIGKKAFYHSSISGTCDFPNYVSFIGESAFEDCDQLSGISFSNYIPSDNTFISFDLKVEDNAFKGSGITGYLDIQDRYYSYTDQDGYTHTGYKSMNFGNYVFANCDKITSVYIEYGDFGELTFENCAMLCDLRMSGGSIGPYSFRGCINLNGTIYLSGTATIGDYAFADFQYNNISLSIYYSSSVSFLHRAFYNSTLNETLDFQDGVRNIEQEAFAQCKQINGSLYLGAENIYANAFADSVFNGSLVIYFNNIDKYPSAYSENIFKGCTGFQNLRLVGDPDGSKTTIPDYAFADLPFTEGILTIDEDVVEIGKYAFRGCGFYYVDFENYDRNDGGLIIREGAFYKCDRINTTVDVSKCKFESNTIEARVFYGCSNLPEVIFPKKDTTNQVKVIGNEAFSGCSSLSIHPDFFLDITKIGKRAFSGCRSIRGEFYVPTTLKHIDEFAFSDCTGLSGRLTIHVNPPTNNPSPSYTRTFIGPSSFKGCKGFKDGKLFIFIDSNEEEPYIIPNGDSAPFRPYYKYDYFLTIGNEAFEDTKFKTVYYSGRFQPECDFDIGFSHTKGIHTSSNYVNKTFCNYPLHSNKLSGGAIAGITIAVIVVVAAIVLLILFLICRNKKNKDNSEDEVEMNQDP